MKALTLHAVIFIATALSLRAAKAEQQFIRKIGTYQIAPKTTLVISRDSAGALQYCFDRFYVEAHETGEEHSKGIITEPFLFYWDGSTRVLWYATTTHVCAESQHGSAVGHDENDTEMLPRVPKVFRSKIRRVFRSRRSSLTTRFSEQRLAVGFFLHGGLDLASLCR